MLRSSFLVALPQFGQTLILSAPTLAISMAAGSAAVTGYSLLLRLFSPFYQGQVLLLNPVWPAYTEAHARDDHAWVGRTFRRTIAAYLILAAGLALAAWQSPLLFRIWIGNGALGIGPRLTILCAAWWILQMTAQPFTYYLMGVGQLRRLAWAATPGLLLTALALFWGLGNGTVDGVLEAGSAALALAVLPPLIWAALRTLRRHEELLPP
jgi:O-antigen/teichoic acid export membrane protein